MRKARVMMAAVASLVLGCAGGGPALGNEQCSEIVYGDGHGSVVITAPEGWVFDHESGRDPGLHALLYPVGTTRTKAPTILYVKTVSKERHPTVQGLISSDVERQKAASPALRIAAGDPVPTARGSKAPVNHLSGGKGGNFESVAYLEAPAAYVMIVLSSRSEASHKEAQTAFADLVKSYHFTAVTGGVIRK